MSVPKAIAPATAPASGRPAWSGVHILALLVGNFALALGPWSVRLSDAGPVATGFWRLFLALPGLAVLALANGQCLLGFSRRTWLVMAGAGLFFALDLATWHIGIGMTRLGNAALFANASSLMLMIWGLVAMRRPPTLGEGLAIAAVIAGGAILFGRSLEIDRTTLAGDLWSILAGFFYFCYLLLLQRERGRLGNWNLLFWSCAAGSPVMLGIALALGESIVPHNWAPVVVLTLGSQIFGQGLLVYSLRHLPPLIVGLGLLTQPGIAILAGWLAFGETLTLWDAIGMALIAGALVLAQVGTKPA